MGTNDNGNGGYGTEVWEKIQAEWLAGQLSLSDISRIYGPSRTTIRAKAKRFKWPLKGSLLDEVRKEIRSQLLEDEGAPAGAPPLNADEIVETAAARGVAIVRNHRALLSRLLAVAGVTLTELETMGGLQKETLEQVGNDKVASQNLVILSKVRQDSIKTVAGALARVIPLERQAYNLDDDRGGAVPIKYVAPDMDKPAQFRAARG